MIIDLLVRAIVFARREVSLVTAGGQIYSHLRYWGKVSMDQKRIEWDNYGMTSHELFRLFSILRFISQYESSDNRNYWSRDRKQFVMFGLWERLIEVTQRIRVQKHKEKHYNWENGRNLEEWKEWFTMGICFPYLILIVERIEWFDIDVNSKHEEFFTLSRGLSWYSLLLSFLPPMTPSNESTSHSWAVSANHLNR